MKNGFTRIFRSVVEWIGPARRVQPEPRITPEQLRDALRDMLADPETRKLLVRSLAGPLVPVSGGQACKPAAEISAGQFGASCGGGDYNFPAKLAVGTTLAPVRPLHVVGAAGEAFQLRLEGAAGSGVSMELYEGTTSRGLIAAGATTFDLYNGNVAGGPRISIRQDTGNVGIGTTNPEGKLHIAGGAGGAFEMVFDNGAEIVAKNTGGGIEGFLWPRFTDNITYLNYGSGGFHIRNSASLTTMFMTNAGNVGIGTTNPGAKLDVLAGNINAIRALSGAAAFFTYYAIGRTAADGVWGIAAAAGHFSSDAVAGDVVIRAETASQKLLLQTGIGASAIAITGDTASIGKLNQIVFLKPSGGDDGAAIQTAINALPLDGGIIMLRPGEYRIETPIVITKDGVKLRGYGGDRRDASNQERTRTLLQWTPGLNTPDNGKIIRMASPDGVKYVQDLEISDLTIDGKGADNPPHAKAAEIALLLDQVMNSVFRNVEIRNMRRKVSPNTGGIGIKLTTTGGLNCDWNYFENCSACNVSQGLVITTQSVDHAPAHDTFRGLDIKYWGEHQDDSGILLQECDNVSFYDTFIFRNTQDDPGAAGVGVIIEDPKNARANYFYHLQTSHGGFLVANVDPANPLNPAGSKNLIFGYDQENSQPPPAAKDLAGNPLPNAEPVLFWINSKGQMRGLVP